MSRIHFSELRALGPEQLNSLHEVVPHVLKTTFLHPCRDVREFDEHLVEMSGLVLAMALGGPQAPF